MSALDSICYFGNAHRGKPWREVPVSYLQWMMENVEGRWAVVAAEVLRLKTEVVLNFETLTKEQHIAGDLIEQKANVGIIGAAGCGKSYIVKKIDNRLLLCPTGISAINADGQTFHSFFRINPSDPLVSIKFIAKIPEAMVIFDEIFFTSPVLLDNVFTQVPEIKTKQLIFTGDPYQLPPVKYKSDEDDNDDFTEAEQDLIAANIETAKGNLFDVLAKHDITVEWVQLSHSVRHQHDLPFADTLSRVRIGKATKEDVTLLNTKVTTTPPEDALILTFRKALVRQYNAEYLTTFSDTTSFEAIPFDNVPEKNQSEPWYLKEKKRLKKSPPPFVVALGCSVVVLYNDSKFNGQRFVNGDLGTVIGYTGNKIEVKLLRTNSSVLFTQEKVVKGKKYMGYYNFGLAVAKAMTIHKSQGCTIFGNVHIHIDSHLATKWKGALYTAMSRCCTLSQVTFNQKLIPHYIKQTQIDYFATPTSKSLCK